jgi:hypothetical protein
MTLFDPDEQIRRVKAAKIVHKVCSTTYLPDNMSTNQDRVHIRPYAASMIVCIVNLEDPRIGEYESIAQTCVLCVKDKKPECSLTPEQIDKYRESPRPST